MPGFYSPGEYDVAGFAVGAIKKDAVIDGSRIEEGDVLLGFASSGVHSNGFSLVRKILEVHCSCLPALCLWLVRQASELLNSMQGYNWRGRIYNA